MSDDPAMYIELTPSEAKVFVVLLERAKGGKRRPYPETHVVHEAGLPEETAGELRDRMARVGILKPEEVDEGGPYLQDWLLFAYLQEKIRRALSGTEEESTDHVLGGKYQRDARREIADKEDEHARKALGGR